MDDNAPIHRARIIADWKEKNQVETPFWPPYSPDLNPLENIRAFVKSELGRLNRKSDNVDVIKSEIDRIWHSLSVFYRTIYFFDAPPFASS